MAMFKAGDILRRSVWSYGLSICSYSSIYHLCTYFTTFLHLSIYLLVYSQKSLHPFIQANADPSVDLSIYLSIYLSVYVSIYPESHRFSIPLNLVIQNCQRWLIPQAGKTEYFLWEPSVLEISSSPAPNRSPFPPSYYWWDKRQRTSCELWFIPHFSNTSFYFTFFQHIFSLYHSLTHPNDLDTNFVYFLSCLKKTQKHRWKHVFSTVKNRGRATSWGTSSFSSGCRISSRSVSKPWGSRWKHGVETTIPETPETHEKTRTSQCFLKKTYICSWSESSDSVFR